jgi:16S rRNA (cytidine1402-2'-O)-methyltransferase
MEKNKKAGTLFVVSTPIGNLKDITLRAIETLRAVDIIAGEDTRITKRLMSAHGISGQLISYREHNRQRAGRDIIEALRQGKDAALVTDAGTPGVSDPGQYLIAGCIDEAIDVVSIPGPSSVIAALSISGLGTDRFVFYGFLPRRGKKRQSALSELAAETKTAVIFESPLRVGRTLDELLDRVGDRKAALCREITKMHEEVIRGRISGIIDIIGKRSRLPGEMAIVLAGRDETAAAVDYDTIKEELTAAIAEHPDIRAKQLAALVSGRLGVPSSVVYKEIIKTRKQ